MKIYIHAEKEEYKNRSKVIPGNLQIGYNHIAYVPRF